MILRGRITTRRKILFAIIAVLLLALSYAWFVGMAITQGIQVKDMDWNADGQVTQKEMLQSFYAVTVQKTNENNRECTLFYWYSSKALIRTDCRTVFTTEENN